MIHSFTVTFGRKYFTDMVTSVPPYETVSLINPLPAKSKGTIVLGFVRLSVRPSVRTHGRVLVS